MICAYVVDRLEIKLGLTDIVSLTNLCEDEFQFKNQRRKPALLVSSRVNVDINRALLSVLQ